MFGLLTHVFFSPKLGATACRVEWGPARRERCRETCDVQGCGLGSGCLVSAEVPELEVFGQICMHVGLAGEKRQ